MGTNNTKQAAWVSIGSFFSFVVGIVSPMILSRYFNKGDYGTYKQVMYVYSTLLTVFTLGLPRAYSYFIPKVPIEQAKSLINKITKIFFILGAAFSALLFLCATPIANVLRNPDLSLAIKYFSPVPILLLPTMGLEGIYAAFRKTQYTAIYTIVTRIFTVAMTVLPIVIFEGTYLDAIIGFDIASLVCCVVALMMKSAPVREASSEKTVITYKQIFSFALPLLYASIWGTIISSANQFFISRYYGNEVFAEYANGFIEIPFVGMILGGISTVLIPVFSRLKEEGSIISGEVVELWRNILLKSSKILFPILLFGVFFSRYLMVCMYGDRYVDSTIFFILRNIESLFYIIPFAPVMISTGKVKEYANIHLFVAALIVISEFICVNVSSSPILIAIIFIICQWVKVFFALLLISRELKVSLIGLLPIKKLCSIFISSSIAGMVALLLTLVVGGNEFVSLGIGMVLFIVIYYLLCFLFRISYKDIVYSFIPRRNSILFSLLP